MAGARQTTIHEGEEDMKRLVPHLIVAAGMFIVIAYGRTIEGLLCYILAELMWIERRLS